MSEPLPYDEIKFNGDVKIEDILYTPDESDIGHFLEVDLNCPELSWIIQTVFLWT